MILVTLQKLGKGLNLVKFLDIELLINLALFINCHFIPMAASSLTTNLAAKRVLAFSCLAFLSNTSTSISPSSSPSLLSRDKYKYGRVKCNREQGKRGSKSNAIAIENYSKQRFFGSLVFNERDIILEK
uniref:Uncharacterized protein n=1 Tax=Glossina brevipalpis TaxID=37001 RepID=A0A1A9WBF7_9MUSC